MRPSPRRALLASLLVAVVLSSGSCSSDRTPAPSGSDRVARSPSAPSSPKVTALSESLLFLRGRSIVEFDIASGVESELGRLPSVDAAADPSGASIAYVASDAPGSTEEDFVAQPELHVRSLSSGDDATIGPGLSPLWHPDGVRLAYLEPERLRVCEGEVCEGSSSVVVADLQAKTRRTLLRGGSWSLLGWLGRDLLVAEGDGSAVTAVSPSGGVERLDLAPTEFWGASPDGRWLVTTKGGGYEISSRDGRVARPIDLPAGGILGSGAWAPSGDRFVAVLLQAGTSKLVEVDAAGRFEAVRRSRGAEGPIVWSGDGSSFVYARGHGLRLEAVHCPGAGACRTLFSWARGVTLLALRAGEP